MLRVVIVGYGEMFTNLIAGALNANCEIVGVFRKESIKYPTFVKYLKDLFNPSMEYSYIKSYNLPEIKAKGVNTENFRKALIQLNPDIVLVGSWGEKFEKETFNIPKIATINAHPSLLPKYRGPNPYYWVIKNREPITGITFHLMDEFFDSGAILAQEEIKLFPTDTGESLKKRTVLVAREVCCELLKALNEDIIIPLQQSKNKVSYFSHPQKLELDFNKTAEENSAMIRAIYPWNRAYFYHNTTPIAPNPLSLSIEENSSRFTKAGTIIDFNYNKRYVSILCADGKVLKMGNIELYKKHDRFFTKNYIKREFKIGEVLI